MARELGLRRGRAREAAEEARTLPRCSESRWMLRRQLVVARTVDLEPRARSRLRKPLSGSGEAIRAVAARIGARLAEVTHERLHLAAVVLDEGNDALDPLCLRLLAAVEPCGEPVAQLVERPWLLQKREALAHVCDLQLHETALFEVAERFDDPLTFLAGHGVRIDAGPDATLLAAREHTSQEVGAVGIEARKHVVPLTARRTHAVAGIERRALLEEAVELEIREDRLQHERPHVVA